MSKVEEIYESLRDKHGKNKFKAEWLRAWANMIQLDKYSSLETPPAGHFFKSTAECVMSVTNMHTATKESTVSATFSSAEHAALSPAKRVIHCTQCIEQLERWHNLMKNGGITKEQYYDLQASIPSEVKNTVSQNKEIDVATKVLLFVKMYTTHSQ